MNTPYGNIPRLYGNLSLRARKARENTTHRDRLALKQTSEAPTPLLSLLGNTLSRIYGALQATTQDATSAHSLSNAKPQRLSTYRNSNIPLCRANHPRRSKLLYSSEAFLRNATLCARLPCCLYPYCCLSSKLSVCSNYLSGLRSC